MGRRSDLLPGNLVKAGVVGLVWLLVKMAGALLGATRFFPEDYVLALATAACFFLAIIEIFTFTAVELPIQIKTDPSFDLSEPNSGYVYLLQGPKRLYKIGHTKHPEDRIHTFSVKLPFEVKYIHLIKCDNRIKSESRLHRCFAHRRIRGEWFMLSQDDIVVIKSIKEM